MDPVSQSRFWIGWVEPESGEGFERRRRGRIVGPDGPNESFVAPLDVWSSARYEQQWQEGLTRVLDPEFKASALVTKLWHAHDGTTVSICGERWPMYRDGDVVYLQNQLLIRETFGTVDPTDPYRKLKRRNPRTKVSEWCVSVTAIQEFLQS